MSKSSGSPYELPIRELRSILERNGVEVNESMDKAVLKQKFNLLIQNQMNKDNLDKFSFTTNSGTDLTIMVSKRKSEDYEENSGTSTLSRIFNIDPENENSRDVLENKEEMEEDHKADTPKRVRKERSTDLLEGFSDINTTRTGTRGLEEQNFADHTVLQHPFIPHPMETQIQQNQSRPHQETIHSQQMIQQHHIPSSHRENVFFKTTFLEDPWAHLIAENQKNAPHLHHPNLTTHGTDHYQNLGDRFHNNTPNVANVYLFQNGHTQEVTATPTAEDVDYNHCGDDSNVPFDEMHLHDQVAFADNRSVYFKPSFLVDPWKELEENPLSTSGQHDQSGATHHQNPNWRPPCKYGSNCNNKHPDHLQQYYHQRQQQGHYNQRNHNQHRGRGRGRSRGGHF